jgi:hypothetical protein
MIFVKTTHGLIRHILRGVVDECIEMYGTRTVCVFREAKNHMLCVSHVAQNRGAILGFTPQQFNILDTGKLRIR